MAQQRIIPSTEVDRDIGGESGRRAQAESDILSLSLPAWTPNPDLPPHN